MTSASTLFHTGTRSSFNPARLELARLVTSRVHHSCCARGRSSWSGSGRAATLLLLFMRKGNFVAEWNTPGAPKQSSWITWDVFWMELWISRERSGALDELAVWSAEHALITVNDSLFTQWYKVTVLHWERFITQRWEPLLLKSCSQKFEMFVELWASEHGWPKWPKQVKLTK